MENILKHIAATVFAALIACSLYAQSHGTYEVDQFRNEVYYEGRLLQDADYLSFVDLGFGYGKDRNHVYLFGKILEYVDPSTFRVDRQFAINGNARPDAPGHHGGSSGYYKTNFDVFYNGSKIQGAHTFSFEILSDGYAKDSFNVYWNGTVVQKAVSSSFVSLGWGYAKDAFNVFWCGVKIEGVFPSSFKVTRDGYAEDAFNTYYNGRKIK